MTQKAKHTPGPWKVVIDDYGHLAGRPAIYPADEDLDCCVIHWDGFVQQYWRSARGEKEIQANARLIAAAPKLLDSHEPERGGADFLDWVADRLVNVYGESENVDFVICLRRRASKAREAISQAIGV